MRPIRFAFAFLTAAHVIAAPSMCAAQAYPSKPVRVITPWPTGGLTDVVGRLIFQKISETTGQQFVIDNRPGAAGTIGADIVAKSKPDGYILMVHSTTHVNGTHSPASKSSAKRIDRIARLLVRLHPPVPANASTALVFTRLMRPSITTDREAVTARARRCAPSCRSESR